jgi:hypothetical protein
MLLSVRIYAPVGMLGYGFPERSLQEAVIRKPDVIAVDAGSTDPGPYYLGVGRPYTSRAMVKRDLGLILGAASSLKVPVLVGSAGGSGAKPHVEWTLDIVREVAAEQRLKFRTAVIWSDVERSTIERAIERSEIIDFEAGRTLTAHDVRTCEHIVAQMGVEPIIHALEEGADLVIAGRTYDAALAAAVPIMRGCDRGLALHLGKIVECGSLVALPRASDGVIAEIHDDYFTVDPADPDKRCTVELVAAHTLYEKSDPYHLHLPGGMIDLTAVRFDAEDPRTVRVAGSRFAAKSPYLVKLEGSARVGYRTLCIGATRDPVMIREIDDVIARSRMKIANDLSALRAEDYSILFRLYGRDGVMGSLEPRPVQDPQELTVLIEVVAVSQEIADTVCALARSAMLHIGYSGRIATAGNLAFPYSPAEFPAPEAYEFRIYHLMQVADPFQLFPVTWEHVGKS